MEVFVYGTLTESDRVDAVLGRVSGARYELGSDAVLEGFRRVEGEYPTLAPGGRVEGRLLEVDDVGLDALDSYEGVEQGLYERVRIPRSDDADDAWVYVGDPDRLGVEERVEWPAGASLADRVRTERARRDVVIRPDE
jgi:gamma-glutamylaminecyclotransferase